MSSLVLWSCPITGVTASWNKGDTFTVFVPERTDAQGLTHGITSRHGSRELAIAAAQRKAGALTPMVHVATLSTRHYSFQAVSLVSAARARDNLLAGMAKHAEQSGINHETFIADHADGINVDSMPAESCMRDHSLLSINTKA